MAEYGLTCVFRATRDGATLFLIHRFRVRAPGGPPKPQVSGQTRHLVDQEFLSAMPDGAMLVNAGRGQIVDTDALVPELQAGRLRAALDVTDPEPLPEHHPLWTCPGVIISPHMARTVPGTNALCYTVAAEQLSTFLAGGVPSNVAHERTGRTP